MKICKPLLICAFFVAGISLFSCKSTESKDEKTQELEAPEIQNDVEVEDESAVAEKTESESLVVETESAEIVTENGEGESVEEVEDKSGADEESDGKKGKKQKKNYTGWIDIPVRDQDFKLGKLRIKTKTKLGSYNISVLSEEGKYIPVLSTANEYTSSYYSLKVDKKIYKLTADANTKTKAKKNEAENGITMYYGIDNVADVQINYEFIKSHEKNDEDMIKVTATVQNTGARKSEFSLKSILDTVLGESTACHFYTSENIPIKSEVMYRTMQNEKWFISKNNNVKMQLLFDGADISKIESVSFANYVTLDIKSWEPEMLSYRAFDTVLSYNNSAVGISWPSSKLGVGESVKYVYYMAFSTGIEEPLGANYIYSIPVENVVQEPKVFTVPVYEEKSTVEKIESTPVIELSVPVKQGPVAEPEVPKIVSNVQFDVSKLTKEQLSPEYIQNLLDRIAALEEDGNTLNRDELLQLNAELDAILEVLRQ